MAKRAGSNQEQSAVAVKQAKPEAPGGDKRWKMVNATMRRNGYAGHALIETLHTVQAAFGYLDDPAMEYVAAALNQPLSRVYGVATFYHLFTLKPQGEHTCVVCTGTACYIKGASDLLESLSANYEVAVGGTTEDRRLSVVGARCIGACGLAPAVVLDGQVLGNLTVEELLERVAEVV